MGNYGEDFSGQIEMDSTGLWCSFNISPFDNKGTTPSSPISIIHSETDSNDVQLCMKNFEEAMSAQPQNMDPAHLWHFVELMSAMKDNGDLTSNAFRQEQFQALSGTLFRQFSVRFMLLFLRKKYNNLKGDWKLYRELKSCSGVTVESHTGALNASDEQWAFWIQRNSNVRKFRKNGPPCYDELTKLFKDNTAIGDINIE